MDSNKRLNTIYIDIFKDGLLIIVLINNKVIPKTGIFKVAFPKSMRKKIVNIMKAFNEMQPNRVEICEHKKIKISENNRKFYNIIKQLFNS